jgi:hypothetical protein
MAEHAESQNVDVRSVSYIAAGLIAILVAIVGAIALLFPDTIARRMAMPAEFPQPAVRTDERAERLELEKTQRDRLSGKTGGIPIEEAMTAIAGKGTKAYDPVGSTR